MSERKHEITKTNLFTSFAEWPPNLRFENQEKNETVILFLRQHLITLVPMVILGVVFIFAPTVLFPLFLKMLSTTIKIPVGYIIVGTFFWYIAAFGMLLAKFLHWFFNIFIVTNERIIDIDFINLLYKDVAEAQLSRVQDISYNQKGIFGTMFNYGNVVIQTAGELPNFSFEIVPKPSEVVDIISDAAKLKAKSEGNGH